MSGEVWYSVARNDVFPEEFGTFLLGSPRIREAFMRYHGDLLTAESWQATQAKIRDAHVVDFFPYPENIRFCHVFEQFCGDASQQQRVSGLAAEAN